MMFFFKPKVIHLDCFTMRPEVHELFPIDYTYKFFPQWWKDLPKVIPDKNQWWGMNTIKSCTGLNNFYANGITIPMWSDFLIEATDSNFKGQFSDRQSHCGSHSFDQMKGYLNPKEYFHLKISSPWLMTCKEDLDFTWVQHTWAFNKPEEIIIPPGVNGYKFQTGTNINIFAKYAALGQKKNILIESGQPMVNIIPMSERKIKLKTHLVDEFEFNKVVSKNVPVTFSGLYNSRKKISQSQEKKCPFHL